MRSQKDYFTYPLPPMNNVAYPLYSITVDTMPCNLTIQVPGGKTLTFDDVAEGFTSSQIGQENKTKLTVKVADSKIEIRINNTDSVEMRAGRFVFIP